MSWDREGFPPACGVGCGGLDEANKIVGSECAVGDHILRVGDIEEERVEDVAEGGEVVITWLTHNGLEAGGCGGKSRSDLLGSHQRG